METNLLLLHLFFFLNINEHVVLLVSTYIKQLYFVGINVCLPFVPGILAVVQSLCWFLKMQCLMWCSTRSFMDRACEWLCHWGPFEKEPHEQAKSPVS